MIKSLYAKTQVSILSHTREKMCKLMFLLVLLQAVWKLNMFITLIVRINYASNLFRILHVSVT